MSREKDGFKKLVAVIGEDFCQKHKDVSCFSYENIDEGLFCFLGFDLHANERKITLTCDIDEWDVYATCIVTDNNIEIKDCKLPANI